MAFEPPVPSAVRNVPCARLACNGLTVVRSVARFSLRGRLGVGRASFSGIPEDSVTHLWLLLCPGIAL
jgi:hypothetical protein